MDKQLLPTLTLRDILQLIRAYGPDKVNLYFGDKTVFSDYMGGHLTSTDESLLFDCCIVCSKESGIFELENKQELIDLLEIPDHGVELYYLQEFSTVLEHVIDNHLLDVRNISGTRVVITKPTTSNCVLENPADATVVEHCTMPEHVFESVARFYEGMEFVKLDTTGSMFKSLNKKLKGICVSYPLTHILDSRLNKLRNLSKLKEGIRAYKPVVVVDRRIEHPLRSDTQARIIRYLETLESIDPRFLDYQVGD